MWQVCLSQWACSAVVVITGAVGSVYCVTQEHISSQPLWKWPTRFLLGCSQQSHWSKPHQQLSTSFLLSAHTHMHTAAATKHFPWQNWQQHQNQLVSSFSSDTSETELSKSYCSRCSATPSCYSLCIPTRRLQIYRPPLHHECITLSSRPLSPTLPHCMWPNREQRGLFLCWEKG